MSIFDSSQSAGIEKRIKQTISGYFDIYLNAMTLKSYPDFSKVTVQNANTKLYEEMVKYEVDSAILFEVGFSEYEYSLEYDKFDMYDNRANISVKLSVNIRFERASDNLITRRNISFAFSLIEDTGNWLISSIESNHVVFVQFIESLKCINPLVEQLSKEQIQNEVMARLDPLKKTTEIARYGVINDEGKRKLAEIKTIELSPSKLENNALTSLSVSYDKTNAISYANSYATEGSSSTNRLFYYTTNDCTNFLSQCVWAGYGGYISTNLSQTQSNITNKFRMVNASGSNWYTAGWFGHTNGGSGPWEQVVSHWNFVVDLSKTIGPSGYGYNDGNVYSNFSASLILTGEALQFYNHSTQATYQHSVFTVNKGAGNTYADVYCNAHSSEYKNEPLTTFITAFGSSNCYMRNLAYITATFNS